MADKFNVTHGDGREVECPSLTLLAKDVFALEAVFAYQDIIARLHPDPAYHRDIVAISRDFREWQLENPGKVKVPD